MSSEELQGVSGLSPMNPVEDYINFQSVSHENECMNEWMNSQLIKQTNIIHNPV